MGSAERYQGVKFAVRFDTRVAPADPRGPLLLAWARRFMDAGLAPVQGSGAERSGAGNLSLRLAAGAPPFLITATGTVFDQHLGPADLVVVHDVDRAARTVSAAGRRAPSSESMLHWALYAARPEAMAIFHGHCAALLDAAPALGLPCTARPAPYGSDELVDSVLAIAGRGDLLILTGHGFVSLGADLEAAGQRALAALVAARALRRPV